MKTRIFLFLFALLSTLTASAYDAQIDGVYYNLDVSANGATVTSGSPKYTGSVTIPSTVTYNGVTYSVTSIGDYAFRNCSGLTSVTIPNSVTSIGDFAFCDCSGLTSVTIPNSVISIGMSAFGSCSGLTSVTIPSSVTSIGNYAFSGCSGLTSIIVDAGNTRYDSRNNCNALIETATNTLIAGCKNTTIPNSVTLIGENAFYSCSGLTSVTIPNSVTSIGGSAFYECSGLTSIVIPSSVTSIGNMAFSYCSGLTSIVIPNSVISIGFSAFYGCSGLTSVTIPNSVTSIGSYVFNECSGLTSVTIPNSVTSIGWGAFEGCRGLTSVTIPNSVTSIEASAFHNCSGLTSVTIPNSVTLLGAGAFNGCSGLTSLTIPKSVTNIGNGVFVGCSGLTSIVVDAGNTRYDSRNNCNAIIATVTNNLNAGCKNTTIPNSVTSIGGGAFSGCSGLTSVTIPNSVTEIGADAFRNCSGLTSVTIPNSVTSIGADAFRNCSRLTSVTCEATSVPSTGSNVFSYVPQSSATLYVPASALEDYKAKTPWSGFGTILTLSGETPVIPETPKCATPTIAFVDGTLTFDCETEGVEYVYHMDYIPAIDGNGNSFSLPKTKVTVYATKKGYEDSDVATKEIEVGGGEAGVRGDVNLDGEIGMPDVMFIVNYILNGKFPDEE